MYYEAGKKQLNLVTYDYCVLYGRLDTTKLKQLMTTVYYKVGKTQLNLTTFDSCDTAT